MTNIFPSLISTIVPCLHLLPEKKGPNNHRRFAKAENKGRVCLRYSGAIFWSLPFCLSFGSCGQYCHQRKLCTKGVSRQVYTYSLAVLHLFLHRVFNRAKRNLYRKVEDPYQRVAFLYSCFNNLTSVKPICLATSTRRHSESVGACVLLTHIDLLASMLIFWPLNFNAATYTLTLNIFQLQLIQISRLATTI